MRFDSGRHTVAIILISRLLVSTDENELQRIAQSRYGLVLLERMREVVLQLASPAAPSLQMAQVQTLFNTVGSTLKRDDVYRGLLGLHTLRHMGTGWCVRPAQMWVERVRNGACVARSS